MSRGKRTRNTDHMREVGNFLLLCVNLVKEDLIKNTILLQRKMNCKFETFLI